MIRRAGRGVRRVHDPWRGEAGDIRHPSGNHAAGPGGPARISLTGGLVPMQQPIHVILHLMHTLEASRADILARAVESVDGVATVRLDLPDDSVLVEFDVDRTGVGEIVREVEETGVDVAAVALRTGSLPRGMKRGGSEGPSLMGSRTGLSSGPRA